MKFAAAFVFILAGISNVFAEENVTDSGEKDRDKRLIGGKFAQPDQFPYHVSMIVNGHFRCGGSLISKSHVLTAAHCVHAEATRFDAYNIRILVRRLSLYEQRPAEITADVEEVFFPVTYSEVDWGYLDGDIAVLKLNKQLDIPSDWLARVPKNHENLTGKLAVITGQGINRNSRGFGQEDDLDGHLRFSNFTIISNQQCSRAWDNQHMPDSLICAHGDNRDALCGGDSGGPLIVNREVVGVVSIGSPVCQRGFPEVFTRVSSYVGLIQKVLNNVSDRYIKRIDLKNYYNAANDGSNQGFDNPALNDWYNSNYEDEPSIFDLGDIFV